MQIRVNFVENHNMKIGRYDVPIDYLKNVVTKYPDHAFGHYFLVQMLSPDRPGEFWRTSISASSTIFATRDAWWSAMAEKYGVGYPRRPFQFRRDRLGEIAATRDELRNGASGERASTITRALKKRPGRP